MHRVIRLSLAAMLMTPAVGGSLAIAQGGPASQSQPAPLAPLIKTVDIPYQRFTLPNGLRVLVHTDRKAPVVAVSIWYNVGSKMEPPGKTGFAHLFEHLMFNGSEHSPGDFFEPLQAVGATDFNGTTWFDRTNYFETVPTSALDVALYLEADRMGWLLGGLDKAKLDNQRGVVQNEKRQGDNQPYGLVEYVQLENLLPPTHPYGHSTIGSMEDLDRASLDDVKAWFVDHYGPNNAVLVLAGDIDLATAKAKVGKWFGNIPAGKAVPKVDVPIPTLPARKDVVMKDRVATTRLYRHWVVPGLNDPEAVLLDVGATVLGGLASSRLDNLLVRQEQTAVAVTSSMQAFAQLGFFEITVDVRPGVDADTVSRRLDQIVAEYIANGPSADEVKRVATRVVAARIAGLEQVGGSGGKAVALAEGELYSGDPDFYKKELAALAAATPEAVTRAMGKWLTRPVLAIKVEPGARQAYQEAKVAAPPRTQAATPAPIVSRTPTSGPRSGPGGQTKIPSVGNTPNIDFPTVETTTLSNGIKVHFARRTTVPTVRLSVVFDAGNAADPRDKLGTQLMTLSMLDEGTKTRNAIQIAEEKERLGASISSGASMDRTTMSLYALKANLGPSLDLLADIIQNPAFAPIDLERVRGQQLARIASELTEPSAIASRTLPTVLFGPDHPYGKSFTGSGDAAVVKSLTGADLAAFHRRWIRPDNAEIFAVGDVTLAELKPMLEARFGIWPATRDLPGKKDFTARPPAAQPRIILVNRPQSPQSVIMGAQLLPAKGYDDLVNLVQANDVLGGNFLSRINMNLRETKGWSYGVRASPSRYEDVVPYIVTAPVQADKTGAAIVELKSDIAAFLTTKGITKDELERTMTGSIRELPGSYETSADVLGEMQRSVLYRRPFDFVESLAARYRKMTVADMDAAARRMINPDKFIWVVVGDKEQVLPQLQPLGLPITIVEPGQPVPPA